jgi:hypothetical protein
MGANVAPRSPAWLAHHPSALCAVAHVTHDEVDP